MVYKGNLDTATFRNSLSRLVYIKYEPKTETYCADFNKFLFQVGIHFN